MRSNQIPSVRQALNGTYFKVLAGTEDRVTVQADNIEKRTDFVEEEFSMPERRPIRMAEVI